MANIINQLEKINTATYGKDVRAALHDGLTAVNSEVEELSNAQETFTTDVTQKFNDANTLMKETKKIVSDSKDAIQNATEINNQIKTIGEAVAQSELETNNKIIELSKDIPRVNMILASNFEGEANGGFTSSLYGFAPTTTAMPVVKGKTYTLTVKGFISPEAKSANQQLKVCLYNKTWDNGATIFINEIEPSIQSATFIAIETENLSVESYLDSKVETTNNVVVSWYSLVEGNVPVKEWTPCPFDLESGINLCSGSNFEPNGLNTTDNGTFWNETDIELLEGVPYTFTASAIATKNEFNSGALALLFAPDWSQSVNLFFKQNDNGLFKSVTFIPFKTQKYKFGFYSREIKGTGHNVNCTLKWYTVTRGSKARAWIPSIRDIKGNTTTQLMAIGQQTTRTSLENNNLKIQNEAIGKNTTELILEVNELKDQVKTLSQVIVNMQLNK